MKFKKALSIVIVLSMFFSLVPFRNYEEKVFAENSMKISNVTELNAYDDVRGKDLSELYLKDQSELLYTLDFDTYTKWPIKDKMPQNFDPTAVMEFGKNPGLNIRKLQKEGYTGKGISVAYVDQPILQGHNEYNNLDLHYEIISEKGESTNPSMHGPAVLSLLAGKDIGIVPDATVYFMGAGSCPGDQKNEAAGFQRIIEINKTLPENKKIRIIGMSHRIAAKNGYYLKNSDLLRKAEQDAEKQGIMVIDCDTFNDPILLATRADKNPEDYKSYTIAKKYTDNNPTGKLCVPISRTYAAGYVDDKKFYQYTQNGGQSWSVPYIVGVIAMGLQVNPKLTKTEAMKYLYDSGYNFQGGKIINPEGFISMVKQNSLSPHDVNLDKDYRYFLYNKNKVSEEDLKSINEYANKFNDGTTSVLKDVSGYNSAVAIYDMLKNDSKNKNGKLKGIQIFGTSKDVPAFDIHFKIQMKDSIDDSGNFNSDFFYSNFNSDSNSLKNDFSMYKAFNEKLNVSFLPEWTVSRLPLIKGEIAPYIYRNNEYVDSVKDKPFGNFVNFSNPIFPNSQHSDDFGYFLEERIDKEFNILSSSEYKLYGNKQGTYPVNTNVIGDFTKENISKENKNGIKEFIINTHGQWDNIDQSIFTTKDSTSEKRISFLNKNTINSVLSSNYYDLDLWTCLNGYNLDDSNLVHEAMASGKCMSAMAASSIISNNGVHNDVSLEDMKKNNFYYFYLNYMYNRALGKSRSESFNIGRQAYVQEILKNTDMLLDGNYQFNLLNVLSYHYFGLIEYWDFMAKNDFNPKLDNNTGNDSNTNGSDNSNTQTIFNGSIKFNTNYSNGDFKVNSFKAERVGTNVEFTLNYDSLRDCDFSFFNPPNGDKIIKIIRGGIKKGTNIVKFNLNMDEFNKALSSDSITMGFGFDDKPNWIMFNTLQLKPLLSDVKTNENISINDANYELFKEINNVEINKDWTIVCKDSIEPETVDSSRIFVLDDDNKKVNVEVLVDSKNDKNIVVKHINTYNPGKTYRLYINNSVKSKNGIELKKGIMLKFTMKN